MILPVLCWGQNTWPRLGKEKRFPRWSSSSSLDDNSPRVRRERSHRWVIPGNKTYNAPRGVRGFFHFRISWAAADSTSFTLRAMGTYLLHYFRFPRIITYDCAVVLWYNCLSAPSLSHIVESLSGCIPFPCSSIHAFSNIDLPYDILSKWQWTRLFPGQSKKAKGIYREKYGQKKFIDWHSQLLVNLLGSS